MLSGINLVLMIACAGLSTVDLLRRRTRILTAQLRSNSTSSEPTSCLASSSWAAMSRRGWRIDSGAAGDRDVWLCGSTTCRAPSSKRA